MRCEKALRPLEFKMAKKIYLGILIGFCIYEIVVVIQQFASQPDSPTLIRTPVYKSSDCMPR